MNLLLCILLCILTYYILVEDSTDAIEHIVVKDFTKCLVIHM